MIHYQLQCGQAHGFDGWFKDSASFEKQAKRGLIECPACGGTDVVRALMAPALAKREALPVPVAEPPPPLPHLRKLRPDGFRRRCWRHCSAYGPRWRRTATTSVQTSPTGHGRCTGVRLKQRGFTERRPRSRRRAWPRKVSPLRRSPGCHAPTGKIASQVPVVRRSRRGAKCHDSAEAFLCRVDIA